MKYQNWTNDDLYGWQTDLVTFAMLGFNMHTYEEMVSLIYDHIKNPEQNVLWTNFQIPIFRFRKSEDQLLFVLRWK